MKRLFVASTISTFFLLAVLSGCSDSMSDSAVKEEVEKLIMKGGAGKEPLSWYFDFSEKKDGDRYEVKCIYGGTNIKPTGEITVEKVDIKRIYTDPTFVKYVKKYYPYRFEEDYYIAWMESNETKAIAAIWLKMNCEGNTKDKVLIATLDRFNKQGQHAWIIRDVRRTQRYKILYTTLALAHEAEDYDSFKSSAK